MNRSILFASALAAVLAFGCDQAKEAGEGVSGAAQSAAKKTGEAAKGAADAAGDAAKDAADAAGDMAKDAADAAGDAAHGAADKVGDAAKAAGDAAHDMADKAGDMAEGAADKMGGAVSEFTSSATGQLEGYTKDLGALKMEAGKLANPELNSHVHDIEMKMADVKERMGSLATNPGEMESVKKDLASIGDMFEESKQWTGK